MARWGVFALPSRYWARQSLRARLTLLATVLFALAVATGAVLVIVLQRYALLRVLDASSQRAATELARLVRNDNIPNPLPTNGGVTVAQILDAKNHVVGASAGPESDHTVSLLTPAQLAAARAGERFQVTTVNGTDLRALAIPVGRDTVVVFTDVTRVNDSVRVLTRAALIGAPIAVILLGLSTYFVVALTLRSVAALRHGAADISAAGLARQRLPVPSAHDEIHRLAVTLNEMLDRIESATARQRTFVGDAAHELRSPLASLRLQLEVAQRVGAEEDWPSVIDDVLIDVTRLERLVQDLLALARLDETGAGGRREPVDLRELVDAVVPTYANARVTVVDGAADDSEHPIVNGDREQLRRVVVNLVDNAVRYAHSQVAVDLKPQSLGDGDRVLLTVTDDGPGLPPEERERVFDRFYRAESSRSRDSGGTGLGLPIVRDLVRAHQGNVELRARPDGATGLQAAVTLPLLTANGGPEKRRR